MLSSPLRRLQLRFYRLAYEVAFKRGRHFHVWLAIVLSILLIADQASFRMVRGMQNSTFDLLVRYRLHYPAPDRDIVIIDIDDASLSVLASRYGRWPWPRALMGEVLAKLNEQNPRAIIFDILFSEPDLKNPESLKPGSWFDIPATAASRHTVSTLAIAV